MDGGHIFHSNRKKYNFKTLNYNPIRNQVFYKLDNQVLFPFTEVDLKQDLTSGEEKPVNHFIVTYLADMELGEVNYYFIPKGVKTKLMCMQFGKC